ncbi:MAG TPA: Rieske 2Fe-2S domain-containing protein [bacterium]|nr:Rieske 2Fe-2S domain-containing protein [bacterium]
MRRKRDLGLLKIAAMDELKNGGSKKFVIHRSDRSTEAFLIKTNGKFYAYLNLCRHWTVGLDFDDNEFFSEDGEWLVCKNHGAIYSPATGDCASGPCGGAALYGVPLIEKDGFLYADVAHVDWGEA